ncbi:antibiotic biosynthesis monooxygenase family protein [Roseicyclus persicicus]|uniref:Antibiotic biosynthesis monooxygenase n=1 Tax=Roseicyclus persicicus TaxID=2650661 RepID=A0A7X6H102_9RHOB|nr:antibiotic biosynthesis monooxygenase family protein [Roseibacterium persicicum]NKX46041.1 antibiotic biosynthesis monooxygenase [Roseibacterium persicicum]
MHGLFFDVQPKPGHMVHYFDHVARLKPVLARHEGLLFLDRYRPLDDPDALLSHQLWADEAALAAWRADPTHRASQSAGRKIHFDAYRIRVGEQVIPRAGEAGRFLVATYGPAPAPAGRAYESVNHPGRFITLAAHDSAEAAIAALQDTSADEVRVFRIARDYTLTDRAEAPPRPD